LHPDTATSSNTNEAAHVEVRKLAVHKDGIFVAHLNTGVLQMYTVNGVQLGCIDARENLNVMKMIPGGHSLVTGGDNGNVLVRSLTNLAVRYALNISDYGPIYCITFNPPTNCNEQFMFVGTQDGSVTVICAQREEDKGNIDQVLAST
jgi:hypothetical protein